MDEDLEKKNSCCSSKDSLLPQEPAVKKSLTLLSTTSGSACQDECCKVLDADSANAPEEATGRKNEYRVHGMDCPACAVTIEKTV